MSNEIIFKSLQALIVEATALRNQEPRKQRALNRLENRIDICRTYLGWRI